MSVLLDEWRAFSQCAEKHVRQYIAQYGDGQRTDAADLISQAREQLALVGGSDRSGHDEVFLLRAVHFLQMAHAARSKQCDKRGKVHGVRDEGPYKLYTRGAAFYVGLKDEVVFRRVELTRQSFEVLLAEKRQGFIDRARAMLDQAKRIGSPLYYEVKHGQ